MILTVDVMRVPGAPGEAIFSAPGRREGGNLYEVSLGPEWKLIERKMWNRDTPLAGGGGARAEHRALPGAAEGKGGTETADISNEPGRFITSAQHGANHQGVPAAKETQLVAAPEPRVHPRWRGQRQPLSERYPLHAPSPPHPRGDAPPLPALPELDLAFHLPHLPITPASSS